MSNQPPTPPDSGPITVDLTTDEHARLIELIEKRMGAYDCNQTEGAFLKALVKKLEG